MHQTDIVQTFSMCVAQKYKEYISVLMYEKGKASIFTILFKVIHTDQVAAVFSYMIWGKPNLFGMI